VDEDVEGVGGRGGDGEEVVGGVHRGVRHCKILVADEWMQTLKVVGRLETWAVEEVGDDRTAAVLMRISRPYPPCLSTKFLAPLARLEDVLVSIGRGFIATRN
jgi:hypothetical protein